MIQIGSLKFGRRKISVIDVLNIKCRIPICSYSNKKDQMGRAFLKKKTKPNLFSNL